MIRRRVRLVSVFVTALAATAGAAAVGQASAVLHSPAGSSAPPTTPAPPQRPHAPRPSARLLVERVYALNARRIALLHDRVQVRAVLPAAAVGRVARVTVRMGRLTLVRARRTVRPAGAGGRFTVQFPAARVGRLRVYAVVGGLGRTLHSRWVDVIVPGAGAGAHGLRVVFLQHRLQDLNYMVGLTGAFDGATANAVMAYRKYTDMALVEWADRLVFERLAVHRGAFRVRFPWHGRHAEATLGHQVLALILPGGRVSEVLPMSSGKPSTPSPLGSFSVYLQTPGINSLGMFDSNYFLDGYAIHGYPDVPPWPASHGCLRIPLADAAFVFGWLNDGAGVDVYE
jgi:hypothetical protein